MTETVITIVGNNTPVNFRSLTLTERMLDVNHFSYSAAPEEGTEATLSAIIAFKEAHLGKEVQIKFQDENGEENHLFKGIILSVNSSNNDDLHNTYRLSGKGLFCKLDGRLGCNAFLRKSISTILTELNTSSGTTISGTPATSGEVYYTAQYNQTAFGFMKFMATRYGEWMYYKGGELVFGGKPSGAAIQLVAGTDIDSISIDSHAADATNTATGYDARAAEPTTASTVARVPAGSGLLSTAGNAGANVFTSCGTGSFSPSSLSQAALDAFNRLQQQAVTANSVFISGSTDNSKLTVGSVITITDSQDTSGKQFIITEAQHSANNTQGYSNHITAIPAESEVPPYSNPWIFRSASTQNAVVKDNADPDKLDRVKVWFPWMSTVQTTQWIRMMTPHTGADKGFRWLPEIDETVMVGFLDDNVDRPVALGAVFDNTHKSNLEETGNHIKLIGSRTQRRMEINDDTGMFKFSDKDPDIDQANTIALKRKDDDTFITIQSLQDPENASVIILKNQDTINLGITRNNMLVAEIILDATSADGGKVTIHSTGKIEINGERGIKMTSQENIEIEAMMEVKIKGTQGVKIKGMTIEAKADTTVKIEGTAQVDVKGSMVKVAGDMAAEISASGMTTVRGSIVMIN